MTLFEKTLRKPPCCFAILRRGTGKSPLRWAFRHPFIVHTLFEQGLALPLGRNAQMDRRPRCREFAFWAGRLTTPLRGWEAGRKGGVVVLQILDNIVCPALRLLPALPKPRRQLHRVREIHRAIHEILPVHRRLLKPAGINEQRHKVRHLRPNQVIFDLRGACSISVVDIYPRQAPVMRSLQKLPDITLGKPSSRPLSRLPVES